ncbi:uncharacterized protein N7473_013211 [Penicillium subrubescens]|uniref:uncharacterized protein n=1 Tax=Penicillium subrubescens TaxID=1316194 RepID=UPI00254554F8|nr:uncharacterized protein N7473_013211 [Penicillium subrubescens]KAJ5873652.1 hypothetical protein N7473_013211 [Penicillium subrubescens]
MTTAQRKAKAPRIWIFHLRRAYYIRLTAPLTTDVGIWTIWVLSLTPDRRVCDARYAGTASLRLIATFGGITASERNENLRLTPFQHVPDSKSIYKKANAT